jgi:hypothetical protein
MSGLQEFGMQITLVVVADFELGPTLFPLKEMDQMEVHSADVFQVGQSLEI